MRSETAGKNRDLRGGEHSPGDGFTVEKAPVVCERLEGVANGMAEIQDLTRAAFALVSADDASFLARAALDEEFERAHVEAQNGGEFAFEEIEEQRVANDAIFDDFINAGAKLAQRKRAQNGGIDDHHLWRMEGADEILAFGKVDAGFSADGAIHLRNESRGNMHDTNAAEITGGNKTGNVADNASADGEEQRMAVSPQMGEVAADFFDGGKALSGFAVVKEHEAACVERAAAPQHRRAPMAPNVWRRKNENAFADAKSF